MQRGKSTIEAHSRTVVAIAACGAALLLTGCSSTPASSASAAPVSSAPTSSAPVSSAPLSLPDEPASSAESEESPTVSVIGDSFSSGNRNSIVWPDVLADRFGWTMHNVSTGGAGYVAGGTPFDQQVDGVIDRQPDVVLIVGSENDVFSDPNDVEVAAASLFARLATEAPSSRLIVIGPIWSTDGVPVEMTLVNDAVQQAATDAGLPFVDALPQNWLGDPEFIQDDGDHPTDEGQVRLADDIADALRSVDPQLLG